VADAERKQGTVLLSDLTATRRLAERLDPEETREIMAGVCTRAAQIGGREDSDDASRASTVHR